MSRSDTPSPRIPDFSPADLSPEQRRIHDAILAGPRGIVEGPLRVWLTSPDLADRAQALGEFCRFGTSLEPRLSELAIITVGAVWRAGFEWHVHAPIAQRHGIAPAIVEAIRAGKEPFFTQPDEAAIHAFVRELLVTYRAADATYAALVAQIGIKGAVELVGIVGYYSLISMTITAFRIPVPAGSPEPFEEG